MPPHHRAFLQRCGSPDPDERHLVAAALFRIAVGQTWRLIGMTGSRDPDSTAEAPRGKYRPALTAKA